jgi:hypothetical protein
MGVAQGSRGWGSRGRTLAAAAAGILLGVLSGCGGGGPPPARIASGHACLAQLTERGATFESRGDIDGSGSCGITNAVALRASPAALQGTTTLSCPMALAVTDFERDIVQPAAQRYLGERVVRMRVLSAYRCDHIAGSGRLSQHAIGQAIDIASFETARERITVQDSWRDRGPRGEFLRAVARGACARFSVVLTPNSNRDHYNHFHLDIGPYHLCSV